MYFTTRKRSAIAISLIAPDNLDIKEDAQLSHDEMVAMVFLLRQSRISSVGRFSSSRSALLPGADKIPRRGRKAP
jgi:hypothetical protein